MATITAPAITAGAPTPNSIASPDNGVDSVINPNLGFAQQLAGAAAAAPAAAVGTFNGKTLPAYDPNAGAVASPGTRAAAVAQDPTASPLHKFVAGLFGGAGTQSDIDALAAKTPVYSRLANFVAGDDATKAAMDQRDQTAATYQRQDVQNWLAANPAHIKEAQAQPGPFGKALAGMLDVMNQNKGNPPAVTADGSKVIQDPAKNQQIADGAGVHPDVAHPFTENHQYTEDEFVGALRGKLNWGQASKLWQMQHYVPPAQQAAGQYLGLLAAQSDQAEQAYNAGVKNNLAKADLQKLDKARSDAAIAHSKGIRAMAAGQNLYATDTPTD